MPSRQCCFVLHGLCTASNTAAYGILLISHNLACRPFRPVGSISSTGADPIVADSADTINLTFRIDEAVSDSSVTILNNPANSITPLGNNTFRASYTVTGSEQEGAVVFDISATDLAGNSASIDSTSDNSYVVFDQTPPSNFTVGQVISAGGDTVMPGYWNSTN